MRIVMRIVSASELESVLDFKSPAKALRQAFRQDTQAPVRQSQDRITWFKSAGTAPEDLATAQLTLERS